MRRNRKSNMKKERIIMLASSAFVLAALTMTGIYMKNSNVESEDDGYTLDFTAMEDSADNKMQEIARNEQRESNLSNQATESKLQNQVADNGVQNQSVDMELQNQAGTTRGASNTGIQEEVTEDDLDYMPMEVGSGMVEIPGLTEQSELAADAAEEADKAAEEAAAQDVVVEQALSFTESDGLLRPVSGEVLLSYSMDKSIYFATLDQYKYNPAVIFSATEGADVCACADAKVVDVFENEEIGKAVALELGNGYQVTYGQLDEISVAEGDLVDAGDKLGIVAAPTLYYSVEGSNLYFQLTKDGTPVNPEGMFQ